MAVIPNVSRRKFIGSAAAAAIAVPAIITSKRSSAQEVVGSGDHKFEFKHAWPQLPERYHWQTTHNVCVDPDNNLYVIHEGDAKLTDHPSIFVFDPEGRFIRAFGQQFQGGGHGIKIRVDGGEPFLYVAAYQQAKTFAKMSLKGDLVWQAYAPMESGHYASGEASNPKQEWGKDRFMPTNFAFMPDGGFLLADGYGSNFIHRYDASAKWLSCFGGSGEGQGTFNTAHGLWIDHRGPEAEVVVTDRAHNSLQTFTLDGQYKRTIEGFGLPANVDTHQDLMVIPELVARVSILDKDLNTIATIGDDRERSIADNKANKGFKIRTDESQWQAGKFVHPHDACFDKNGDLYVAEWVSTGRITKLTRA